ncbi:nucleotidyltransferase domain-containing protein [Kribbella sp. NPDC051770]|uniref:nucleotidyltransferase domain-containing protein n=1 Tax=Kribbella sp. NPDC051770 TaxID=3155413 RepID=UPI00342724F0
MDPLETTRRLAAELFPTAIWVLLSGSVLTSARTAGSDLDIVVLLPDGTPGAPRRESLEYDGWPVELFVHDSASLPHYLAKDLPGRRPALHRMVALGTPIVGDPSEHQAAALAALEAGPPALAQPELDSLRYALTDLLDDLTHAPADEQAVIATYTWLRTAETMLHVRNHWVGNGKWLLRELRDLDPAYADRWLASRTITAAIRALADEVLTLAGGPLFAGYQAAGERG